MVLTAQSLQTISGLTLLAFIEISQQLLHGLHDICFRYGVQRIFPLCNEQLQRFVFNGAPAGDNLNSSKSLKEIVLMVQEPSCK